MVYSMQQTNAYTENRMERIGVKKRVSFQCEPVKFEETVLIIINRADCLIMKVVASSN